jgi:hypothetical protein
MELSVIAVAAVAPFLFSLLLKKGLLVAPVISAIAKSKDIPRLHIACHAQVLYGKAVF